MTRTQRVGALVFVIGVVMAGLGGLIAAGAQPLPKLKQPGEITAHASSSRPTASASAYRVAWVPGLRLRDTTATTAVCVTVKTHDPKVDGLHLTAPAARELAAELRAQATSTAVDVDNHSHGHTNVWKRFSRADALSIAGGLTAAAGGH